MWSGFFLFVNLSSQATLNLFKSSQIFIEVPDHTKAAKFLRKRALKPWRFHSSHPEKFPQHMEHQKSGTWFFVRNEICARKRPRSDLSVNPRKKNTFSRRFVRTSGNLWILLVFWVFFVGPLPGCQWPPGLQLNLYLPLHFLGICVDRVFVGQVWPPLASALLSCRTVGTRDATSIPDSQPNRVKGRENTWSFTGWISDTKKSPILKIIEAENSDLKKSGASRWPSWNWCVYWLEKTVVLRRLGSCIKKKEKRGFFILHGCNAATATTKCPVFRWVLECLQENLLFFLCVLTGNI